MEWIKIENKLPEGEGSYLVRKRYDFKDRKNERESYFQTQILVYNPHHECWDGEDGDDYDCDILQVSHWMPLPPDPTQ